MASIYKDIIMSTEAPRVRAASRNISTVHERFAPGFVIDARPEDGAHRRFRERPGNPRSLMYVVFSLLREWRRRRRGRAALCHMCAGELRDIGLTPAAAAREGRKPFWRA
jgi:uncharacterized protein YjiS (DUF1127 family)